MKLSLEGSSTLRNWFVDNLMEGNADKSHSLISTNTNVIVKIVNSDIKNEKCEKNLLNLIKD